MTSIFRKLSAVVLVPLALCFLLVSQPSQAATYITASITITNIPGVGSNWVVNGNSRTWTNTAGTPAASWIVTGASIAASATNLYNHMAANPYSSPFLIIGRSTPTNFTIFGTSVTVTTNNYSSVSYVTNSGTNLMVVQVPFENVVGATNRTNQAHWLVDGLNRFVVTNALATNATVMSNFLTKGASIVQVVRSPVVFASYAGTNSGLTNGTLFGVNNIAGTNSGYIDSFTNGYIRGATNINPITSNLVNYGSAIRSEGSGGNSLQVGSNAVASGTRSVAVGNGSVSSGTDAIGIGTSVISTNTDATIIGNGAQSLGISSVAVGKQASARESGTSVGASSFSSTNAVAAGVNASASGYASTAIGENSAASSYASVAVGSASIADAHSSVALGFQANSSYSNSAAIGPTDHLGNNTVTTQTNQLVLATANHTVSIPGQLLISGTQSNTVFKGTNIMGGSYSYPRFDLSTLANGNNIAVPVGTNTFIRLSGTVTDVPVVCGIVGSATSGSVDGHIIHLHNDLGYGVTFAQNTSDPVPANRIEIQTGVDVTVANNGWARFVYSGSDSRWHLSDYYPQVGVATNALSTIWTNGVGVSSQVTNLNLIPGTGVTFNTTNASGLVSVQINASGAGGLSGTTNYLPPLRPTSFLPASTNFAYPDETLQTSFLSFPHTNGVGSVIALSATADQLWLPNDYSTNTLAIELGAIITATNGPNASNAIFQVSILRHNHTGQTSTNDAQVGPFDAGSSTYTFAIAASYTGTNKVQTVSGIITNCTIAPGETFSLKLERLNANAADLIGAGVVGITSARLRYTRP